MSRPEKNDGQNLSQPPLIEEQERRIAQDSQERQDAQERQDQHHSERGTIEHFQRPPVSDSEMTIGPNFDSGNAYWIEPGTAEIVIEVIGEHVPVFLVQIYGFKVCQSRKRWIARAFWIGIIFTGLTIIVLPITIKLRNNSAELKNLETNSPSFIPSFIPSFAPSNNPSFSPLVTDDRSKNITRVIFNISGDLIYDPVTPQGRALRWILKYDRMQLDHNSSNILQRYSMMVLFYSLNGPNWLINNGYGSSHHECNWYGVLRCWSSKNIRDVDLTANGLDGTIPDEIFMLSSMEELKMSNNHIRGTIPGTFTITFKNLVLDNNMITGTIPTSLQASRFYAHNNALTGTIPSALLNYKELYVLYLSVNMLRGPFPKIVTFSSRFRALRIGGNDLTGTIPLEIGSFPSLTELMIGRNNFSGTIPTTVGNLSYLRNLHLQENNFEGVIPSQIGLLNFLESLLVQETMLTGMVPKSVCELTSKGLKRFEADCKATSGVLNCSCCTQCY